MPGKRKPKIAKPSTKALIDAPSLVKTLKNHINTYPGKRYYEAHFKQPSQVTAIGILLKKELPDLASQQIEVTEPIKVIVEYVGSKATK